MRPDMNFQYTITRSERETTAIYVRNGCVEVRCPTWLPQSDIDRYVANKKEWIERNLRADNSRLKERSAFVLDYGSMVFYRGKKYPVVAGLRDYAVFDCTAFRIPPDLSPEGVKSVCVHLYITLAKYYLPERTKELARKTGAIPNAVKINNAKTRWGSCTSTKNINFSWRIIMAPDDVIDLVIIHELTHLKVMNHSKLFWEQVDSILPDSEDRKWSLALFSERLARENWDI